MFEALDPFKDVRSAEFLGVWYHRQVKQPSTWITRNQSPPDGPDLKAGLSQGFCGQNDLSLSRLPLSRPPGRAAWAAIFAIFHTAAQHSQQVGEKISTPADEWESVPMIPLVWHRRHACIAITRTTLITMMVVTNARAVFSYSGASGFRASYPSYNGLWHISWPIGQDALVQFSPHDSHALSTDVYPPSFPQRVDRCAQVVAGVVIGAKAPKIQVAFCGRKKSGEYLLKHVVKGFAGAHGSRHLYNMLGGKVYEVDYLSARELPPDRAQYSSDLELALPSKHGVGSVRLVVPLEEQEIIAYALDALPWNHMSWSIHRGMRDILLAFARPTMDKFRSQLAALLRVAVQNSSHLLDERGWEPPFVRNSMGDMAASAILAGEGNSGDSVRIVTDVMRMTAQDWTLADLDEVFFWRRQPEQTLQMDLTTAVALTKVFVLEWSNEFDYQVYHELPVSLYFA